jgi:5-methylcytosine-specific restriction endonuclease McrA
MEVDHITPKHLDGIDAYSNWQLLHEHCHDSKTAEAFTNIATIPRPPRTDHVIRQVRLGH